MARYTLWMITLLTLSLSFSFAQNGRLTGKITDADNGQGLAAVNIVLSETLGGTSNAEGRYNLDVPPGTYQVSFIYIGYEEVKRSVEIAAGQTRTLNVAMNTEAVEGEIVVVSAGKFEQDLGELTVSMEVLQPRMIENKNTTSMDEILDQVPGVSIVDNEPQIRSGSGFSFGAGSRVMILIDDLPILSGDAGRPTWGFFPVENVEQVEVIKGASSVLYGSAALNGVINVRTAYPRGEPKTKVSFFSGFYGDPKDEAAKYWEKTPIVNGANFLHSRIINNLDLMIGGSFLADQGHLGPFERTEINDAGELVKIPYEETYDPFEVNRADAATRGRVSVNLRHRNPSIVGLDYGVNTSWQKAKSVSTLLWDSIGVDLYRPFEGAATTTNQTIGYIDPFINYVSPQGTKYSFRGRYSRLNNDNDNDQANSSNVYFGELQVHQNFAPVGIEGMNLTTGVMGMFTDGESQLYSGGNPDGSNSAENIAWYAQLDQKLFDRLNISGGMRLEKFVINDSSESKPVFRAGVNYQLGAGTFLRASYGQGYRFPSIAEKFVQTQAGFVVVYPNDTLRSETSWNAEAGIKQGFQIADFRGFLDLAYFHQEYDDYIEFTFGGWGGFTDPLFGFGFKSLNTGKSRVTGLDVSLIGQGKIGGVDFQTLTGYTYTKPVSLTPDFVYARETSGGREVTYLSTSSDTTDHILKYRLRHILRADLELNYNRFLFGTSYRYTSFMDNIDLAFIEFDDDPDDPNDGFNPLTSGIVEWRRDNNGGNHIFDMRLGYNFSDRHRLAIVINNLFNKEYSVRPLVIESTRKTVLQYSTTF